MMENLEQIHAECLNCKKCILCKNRLNVVPGSGNPKSEIVFIGEGPGKKEDEMGIPFIGAAGKFLDELLDSIQLKREDIFIANVVKCRPPNNRDPLPEEIKTCKPYLERQIVAIKPKIVATLGRFSMNLFIPKAKISETHGKPQKVGNLLIMPLYHPAAALYNGSMREVLKKDFQILKKLMKRL